MQSRLPNHRRLLQHHRRLRHDDPIPMLPTPGKTLWCFELLQNRITRLTCHLLHHTLPHPRPGIHPHPRRASAHARKAGRYDLRASLLHYSFDKLCIEHVGSRDLEWSRNGL